MICDYGMDDTYSMKGEGMSDDGIRGDGMDSRENHGINNNKGRARGRGRGRGWRRGGGRGMVGVIWTTLPYEPTIRKLYSHEHWSGYHIAYNLHLSCFVAQGLNPLQRIWRLEH